MFVRCGTPNGGEGDARARRDSNRVSGSIGEEGAESCGTKGRDVDAEIGLWYERLCRTACSVEGCKFIVVLMANLSSYSRHELLAF